MLVTSVELVLLYQMIHQCFVQQASFVLMVRLYLKNVQTVHSLLLEPEVMQTAHRARLDITAKMVVPLWKHVLKDLIVQPVLNYQLTAH